MIVYRKIAGGNSDRFGVPDISNSSAVKVWFLTILVHIPLNLTIFLLGGFRTINLGMDPEGEVAISVLTISIIQALYGIIAFAYFLKIELPTTFVRSLMIWLLNFIIVTASIAFAAAFLIGIGNLLRV